MGKIKLFILIIYILFHGKEMKKHTTFVVVYNMSKNNMKIVIVVQWGKKDSEMLFWRASKSVFIMILSDMSLICRAVC